MTLVLVSPQKQEYILKVAIKVNNMYMYL